MTKKKKPVDPREKAKQKLIDDVTLDYWRRYPPPVWEDFYIAVEHEANPIALVMLAKDCLKMANCALKRLKDFPSIDDIWPDSNYKDQVEEIWTYLVKWAQDQTEGSD